MKRIVNSRIVLAGIFAVAGLPNLHAQRGCSNATLKGAYGFYSSGTVLPNRTRRVTVAREVYDGNGYFSNTFTVNDNGAVSHNNGSGTYNVNPDCTGTIFTTLGLLQLRLDFVIADGANEIHFLIGSNPPILDVYGVRKKQFPNFERVCSNADLKGTCGFTVREAWSRPAHPASPWAAKLTTVRSNSPICLRSMTTARRPNTPTRDCTP